MPDLYHLTIKTNIVHAFINVIIGLQLDIRKLIGIETDNASVTIRLNNGVFQILVEEHNLSHLFLNRCVYHSIQFAVSHALQENVPRNVEFLIRELYN